MVYLQSFLHIFISVEETFKFEDANKWSIRLTKADRRRIISLEDSAYVFYTASISLFLFQILTDNKVATFQSLYPITNKTRSSGY
jgi:hypothetical protein